MVEIADISWANWSPVIGVAGSSDKVSKLMLALEGLVGNGVQY